MTGSKQSAGQFKKFMQKLGLVAGFLGIMGVVFGAFGAHALEQTLEQSGRTDVWSTAVLYHLIHTVVIYASSLTPLHRRLLLAAGWTWVLGITLFSGSLYVIALGGPSWLGPVTPLGGLALIAGWAMVAWNAITGKRPV